MSLIKEVIKNNNTKVNPIWIMRQAGRYLPVFRERRKQNPNFIDLCLNDNLSSEIKYVFLIPAFFAALISDILSPTIKELFKSI